MSADSIVVTGPTFAEVNIGDLIITPPGGTQGKLSAQLANPTFTSETVGTSNIGTLNISGLLYESAADGIIAGTGGATPTLAAETNRIAVVNNPGDAVRLMPSGAGLTIFIINHGLNTMTVLGNGSDTIDDLAPGTGVPQMVNSEVVYTCVTPGKWYTNGLGTGYAGALPTVSFQNGIQATAGGGQGGAFALGTCINRVTTVATAGDSVRLPASAGGLQITVSNAGAASLNVFPAVGDAINGQAANAAVAVPAGKTSSFTCGVAGQWHAIASA